MRSFLPIVLLLSATAVSAQPVEPPPEAPEGVDYAVEPADTLTDGDVELGMGATGRPGSAPTRSRRMRFSGDELSGGVREGSDDPLAGGSVEGRGLLGVVTVGRLAPRWGRGLVLGAAGDPWQREALDRGAKAAYRGRAGDGVWLRRGRDQRFEALYGRFARRRLAGAHVRVGRLGLGAITDAARSHQVSLALSRGAGEWELALDHAGRWRAEAVLERPLVARPPAAAGGWNASGRVRAGTSGFASLAEAGRGGPAQALAAALSGPAARWRANVFAALWRFRPGVGGARAGLAVERPLAHHGALALGIEEQRGWRRDHGQPGSLATAGARAGGMRQGLWGEWWSGEGTMALGLRHESWGERPWVRAVVRAVTSARIEARGPAGLQLGLTHSVYRVKRGESLYLPEAESDRLVLRALSGEGERTRIEARSPFAGGRVRASLRLTPGSERRARAQWTLDWTRRARIRTSRESRAR